MRVAILASEVVPFAKTGGLADVAGALPKALREHDLDAIVVRVSGDDLGVLRQKAEEVRRILSEILQPRAEEIFHLLWDEIRRALRRHKRVTMTVKVTAVDAAGNPWSGSYVYNSGNLVLDLLYNLMLESTGRLQKCRIYEMTANKTARATIAYLIVRDQAHENAYAKAQATTVNVAPVAHSSSTVMKRSRNM